MASADYTVLTPERVSLEYGIAGVGSRGAAAIIDTFIQTLAIVLSLVAFAALSAIASLTVGDLLFPRRSSSTTALAAATFFAAIVLWIFAITAGYFMLFEILWNGQTPGKRIVGVRVIRESGYPIRPVDAVIRNVVRYVDWLPLFYGIGVIVMLLNRRSKRLGDFACGTIVVREGSRSPLTLSDVLPEHQRAYAVSSADATLVRDFLVRRVSMHPSARAELAGRLATALAQRYHVPLDPTTGPERFLESLSL